MGWMYVGEGVGVVGVGGKVSVDGEGEGEREEADGEDGPATPVGSISAERFVTEIKGKTKTYQTLR